MEINTRAPHLPAVIGIVICLSSTVMGAEFPITNMAQLEPNNAAIESVSYHGKPALKMIEKTAGAGQATAGLKGIQFHDGTIELEVAGAPAKGADATVRGFIGVNFRVKSDGQHYEQFYIRPTNGRAEDQERRNHSTQYVSAPDWPWQRLRQETPSRYESYVDLQAGEWTSLRIVVHGKDARLYVGEASQPCLIVPDLKAGDSEGGIALWIGPGTEGYFRNVRITPSGSK